jgi:KDO2-lipid IV(A) lauroyltransferase
MIPASRRFRYRVEYAGFLLVAAIFRALPMEVASGLSGRLWRWLAPLTHRHGRAVGNLRLAFPDRTEEECEAIARDMWESLGRNFAESFHLHEIAKSDRVTVDPDSMRQLEAMAGRGVVICAAHQANWEIMSVVAIRAGLQPSGIYQRVKNPYVDAWLRRARMAYYTGGLHAKTRKAILDLMRVVQHGGCITMLADLREFSGVRVPFFGRSAPSTTFPAMIARSLGVPLYAWFNSREPGVRFHMWSEEIEVPQTDDKDADILTATANLQAAFERTIRARPAHWMWGHRRWG